MNHCISRKISELLKTLTGQMFSLTSFVLYKFRIDYLDGLLNIGRKEIHILSKEEKAEIDYLIL